MAWNIFRRAEGAVPEQKASATGRVIAWGSSGRVIWSPRDTVSLTLDGVFRQSGGVPAVKLIAEAAAALPLVCQDGARRYEAHPVINLMRRPNAGQGRAELFEALYGRTPSQREWLCRGGGRCGSADRTACAEIRPNGLCPARMAGLSPTTTPSGDGSTGSHGGPVDPVLHIRSFHPQDDHYGLSPMQAAAVSST